MHIVNQHNNQPYLEGPIHLHVTFFMPIPKSKIKKMKPADAHYIVPDLSNLIKWIEDLCSGIIYKDDAIIAEISAEKMYDNNARTEFYFTKFKERDEKKI